jgi:hypothetical protein
MCIGCSRAGRYSARHRTFDKYPQPRTSALYEIEHPRDSSRAGTVRQRKPHTRGLNANARTCGNSVRRCPCYSDDEQAACLLSSRSWNEAAFLDGAVVFKTAQPSSVPWPYDTREDFLTKPIDRAELTVRVTNLLRLKAYSD